MKRITVLLVDDNRGLRREFRKLLKGEDDLEVIGEANNGLEAIAFAKKLRPQVVLRACHALLGDKKLYKEEALVHHAEDGQRTEGLSQRRG